MTTVFTWRTTCGGFQLGKKHCSWWCAIWGEKYDWRAPTRLLVVQTVASASQAKVFKAHAVPQGVCVKT